MQWSRASRPSTRVLCIVVSPISIPDMSSAQKEKHAGSWSVITGLLIPGWIGYTHILKYSRQGTTQSILIGLSGFQAHTMLACVNIGHGHTVLRSLAGSKVQEERCGEDLTESYRSLQYVVRPAKSLRWPQLATVEAEGRFELSRFEPRLKDTQTCRA